VEAKKVLIVEDNELNLKLYLYALRPLNAQILVARNGQEALDLILSEKPDAVVLDIQLPGIGGLEVAKAVRANPDVAGTPIIAVTAYSMAGDRESLGQMNYHHNPQNIKNCPGKIHREDSQ